MELSTEDQEKIENLHHLGIFKNPEMGFKTSQIIVTYPPTQSLKPASDLDLYSDVTGRNTLYVHIPFCTSICTYCSYERSASSEKDERVTTYPLLIEREASLLTSRLGIEKIPVESIYIGGGTPTLLSNLDLEQVLQTVQRYFKLERDGEYTLEGSPETIKKDQIILARELGINRVSIGAESFNDDILKKIGRQHDSDGISDAVNKIRCGGIENIDIDLIRGLPGYNSTMVLEDLQGIANLGVPSVSSYQYTKKPGSRDWKRKTESLSEEELLNMHTNFILGMNKLGYTQRPIDFFNKENHDFKHQLLKWGCQVNQLVLGMGCYGFVNNTQFIHTRSRKRYEENLNEGILPAERAFVLSTEELLRREFIFGLKTEINIKEYQQRNGVSLFETSFSEDIGKFINAGAIEVIGDTIRLTEIGALFADWIQCEFYSPLIKQTESKVLRPKKYAPARI